MEKLADFPIERVGMAAAAGAVGAALATSKVGGASLASQGLHAGATAVGTFAGMVGVSETIGHMRANNRLHNSTNNTNTLLDPNHPDNPNNPNNPNKPNNPLEPINHNKPDNSNITDNNLIGSNKPDGSNDGGGFINSVLENGDLTSPLENILNIQVNLNFIIFLFIVIIISILFNLYFIQNDKNKLRLFSIIDKVFNTKNSSLLKNIIIKVNKFSRIRLFYLLIFNFIFIIFLGIFHFTYK